MGKRGVKPEPTRLKLLKGNPSGRPINKDEPEFEVRTPDCPTDMPEDGRVVWERVVPELLRFGLLAVTDWEALEIYCSVFADFKAANRTIAKEGQNVVSDKGNMYQHPAVGQKNTAATLVKQFAAEFGFTPSSKTGLVSHPMGKVQEAREAKYFA